MEFEKKHDFVSVEMDGWMDEQSLLLERPDQTEVVDCRRPKK